MKRKRGAKGAANDYPRAVIEELLSPEPMENVEASSSRHFVAEIDHEIVGFGAINLEDGEIPVVVVNPDYLRQGIGSLLMQRLEAAAVEKGLSKLSVGSSLYGRHFYAACGFVGVEWRAVTGRRTGVQFKEYLTEKSLMSANVRC